MSKYTDSQATAKDIADMEPEELPWVVAIQLALIAKALKEIAETLEAMRLKK